MEMWNNVIVLTFNLLPIPIENKGFQKKQRVSPRVHMVNIK